MLSTVRQAKEPLATQPPWAALLDSVYTRLGSEAPVLRQLAPDAVPQPYRGLLVHSQDMTPTLEAHYQQPVTLRVLSRDLQDPYYIREVVLLRSDGSGPVEYGVIRIWLNHLPPAAARRVLEAERPFGNILHSESIPHMSWPQEFFCVHSDTHVQTVLKLAQPGLLYGRRNVLLDGARRMLAEVIEILAPASETSTEANGHRAIQNSKPSK
jgi:chorismate-pyruvate lyase